MVNTKNQIRIKKADLKEQKKKISEVLIIIINGSLLQDESLTFYKTPH